MSNKRYQVFVSSTYADLKDERQKVIQTLMEMDCIPAGMELFPAADEDQFEFIKKVIDDCDYYIVIVGGRYGSLTAEGISYTEKEYDYAVEKGLKVIAFLHETPEELPVNKSDIEAELREKLNNFRTKLSTARLVKFWKKPENLPGLVALSMSKTIKMYPATGWIRATKVASEEIYSELNEARKENAQLSKELSKFKSSPISNIENLAKLDEKIKLHGTCSEEIAGRSRKRKWDIHLTWEDIFSAVSALLVENPSDGKAKIHLERYIKKRTIRSGTSFDLDIEDYETIRIQLEAYGLISTRMSKTVKGSVALFWSLTPKGKELMLKLRTIKSENEEAAA